MSKKQNLIDRQFEEWQKMIAKILTVLEVEGK